MCRLLNESNAVMFEVFGVQLRDVTSRSLVNNYGSFGGIVLPCPPSKILIYRQLAALLFAIHRCIPAATLVCSQEQHRTDRSSAP